MEKAFILAVIPILVGALILFMISTRYFLLRSKKKAQENYFIQLEWESEIVDSLRSIIQPLAQEIIEKEVKSIHPNFIHNPEQDIPFYKAPPANRKALSVYYIDNLRHWHKRFPQMLLNKITPIKNNLPKNTLLKPEIKFFGDNRDELVILINDESNELSQLNSFFKQTMREINSLCKKEKNKNLFDIVSSERFPFIPHISLGVILSRHIKEKFLKNISREEQNNFLATIKQKIIEATIPLIFEKISSEKESFQFTKLFLFSRTTRNQIFKIDLKI